MPTTPTDRDSDALRTRPSHVQHQGVEKLYLPESPIRRAAFNEQQTRDFEKYYRYQSLYDSFTRADSTTVGTTEDRSFRPWLEAVGNTEISTNTLRASVLDTGQAVVMTPLGHQEYLNATITARLNASVASAAIRFIFRASSANDCLIAEIVDADIAAANGELRLVKRVAGTLTTLKAVQFGAAVTGDADIRLTVIAAGPIIWLWAETDNSVAITHHDLVQYDTGTDTWTDILKSGVHVGFRFTTASNHPIYALAARTG